MPTDSMDAIYWGERIIRPWLPLTSRSLVQRDMSIHVVKDVFRCGSRAVPRVRRSRADMPIGRRRVRPPAALAATDVGGLRP